MKYQLNDITIYKSDGEPTLAYANDGQLIIPLSDEEKKLDPAELLTKLDTEYNQYDKIRCTGCGKLCTHEEIKGYPLFVGAACEPCWQRHLAHLEDQRRKGHVCRMCGKPYDNCCC